MPRTLYVKNVGRDGRKFTVTLRKVDARRFTLETAAAIIPRLSCTQFGFSVCDAPGAA
jgi:hypothetical protein